MHRVLNEHRGPRCAQRSPGALWWLRFSPRRSRRCIALAQTTDPLPSWNDGAVKKSITDFVARVTTPGGADFVPAEQRIATFDNDGTLWSEQPIYFQVAFALRSRQGDGAAASGMEDQAAVQGGTRQAT